VFVDQNGNGRRDAGERGLAGVRVEIDGQRSVMTDDTGHYKFSGVKNGAHSIAVDRSNLPGLRLASASPVAVRLPGGQLNVTFAFAGAGAIHGVLFNDVSLTGKFSGSEPGIAGDMILEGPGTRRSLSVAGSFTLGGLAPGR